MRSPQHRRTAGGAVYDRPMSGDPAGAGANAAPPPGPRVLASSTRPRRRRQTRYVALAVLGPLVLAIPLAIGLDAAHKALSDRSAARAPDRSGAVLAANGPVRLTVGESPSADDEPLAIRVQGLTPGRDVTITAFQDDYRGVEWTGTATFTTPANGTVSTDRPSTGGSYTGVNPMGLVALMTPADGPPAGASTARRSKDPGRYFFPEGSSWELTVKVAYSPGAAAASLVTATVERDFAPGIDYRPYTLASDGFTGALYTPATTGGRLKAGVLVLDTGEGPSPGAIAARLASHGHPALSVSYIGHPGQPTDIDRIPLESFEKPLSLLRKLGGADGQHLVVLASGRSTEAAQLIAADHPGDVHGLALIGPDGMSRASAFSTARSSWTRGGRDVPFYIGTGPVAPAVALHPERTNGPLLLVCGQLDPQAGCRTTVDIRARLTRLGFGHDVRELKADGIGASVSDLVPYQAHTAAFGGGTLAGESLALPGVWTGLLSWLDGLTEARS